MSDTTEALNLVFDKVDHLVTQYGPAVGSAVMASIQVDGGTCLIRGVVYCGAIVGVLYGGKIGLKHWASNVDDFDSSWVAGMVMTFGAVAVTILGCLAASELLDPWNWVAMFSPKLWLAHMAVLKVLGG